MNKKEIKFRAWDKKEKIMYQHNTFDLLIKQGEFVVGLDAGVGDGFSLPQDKDRFELMQYTGLLDKHGKEIFESDLLKWEDSGDILEVRWIDVSWQVFGSYNKLASHKWEDSEVVGNIYKK